MNDGRQAEADDPRSYKSIAEQYGVSHATVGHIKKRQTWKDVDSSDPGKPPDQD